MTPVGAAPRSHLALMVFAGGMLGSAVRVAVFSITPASAFPWAAVVVNLTGALIVGWTIPALHSRTRRRRRVAFGAVGLVGAYTTFATFAVDVVLLADAGRWPVAGWYLTLSLAGGVIAASAGHLLGQRS